MSVNVDQIVVSDKFKHNNKCFKYFICYQEDEIVLYFIGYQKDETIMYYFTSNEWLYKILWKRGKKTCLFLLKMKK